MADFVMAHFATMDAGGDTWEGCKPRAAGGSRGVSDMTLLKLTEPSLGPQRAVESVAKIVTTSALAQGNHHDHRQGAALLCRLGRNHSGR